jgi:hypothetical protein
LFTNVSFIKDIQVQTRKQSKLKHLIILALRILALCALVIGFAQPFIPYSQSTRNTEAGNAVSIYLDNSFSMDAQSGYGPLLEEGRKKAAEIAAAYKASDKFQLLTNDFEGIHQRLVTKDEFLQMLDKVTSSPVPRKTSEVITRQMDLLQNMQAKNKTLYLISDFQKSTTDLASLKTDTAVQLMLVPLKANPTPNISIDSCWFTSPVHQAGKNVKLKVLIKNVSDQSYEKVPLKLTINENQKAISSFSLPPFGSTVAELGYNDAEPGLRYGKLEITDSPVIYDDAFYFSYNLSANIPVLVVDQGTPNVYLTSLLKSDSTFHYVRQAQQNLDFSSFSSYSLIILDELNSLSSGLSQELVRFVNQGGSLLIIPSGTIDQGSYSALLRQLGSPPFGTLNKTKMKINKLALNHPLFQDVFDEVPVNIDLPTVLSAYDLGGTSRSNRDILISMQNNAAFLSLQNAGEGKIYLLASPLDPAYSNFPQHALFVPVMYKIALMSRPETRLYYTIGSDERIPYDRKINGNDKVIKIKQLKGSFEFIPMQARVKTGSDKDTEAASGLFVKDQIREAGLYQIIEGDNVTRGLAFNYSRAESDLSAYSPAELRDMCSKAGLKNAKIFETSNKNLTTVIEEMHAGLRLWKWFIMLALLFLAGEVLILRFWK